MSDQEGDRFLLDHIRKGDPDSFSQLVDRYSGRLRAFAARRLSGSSIDPEDAVQETLIGLLQSADRLGGVRSLQAYLFQILRNKIVDLARKRPEAHGMHQIPLAEASESTGEKRGYEPVSPTGTPSSYVRRAENVEIRNVVLADILAEVISTLRDEGSFRDLKVLEMLFYGSWKNREIATIVGTSEPTVTRVKTAALEKLARLAAKHNLVEQPSALVNNEDDTTHLIRTTWQENLLSCLKRSSLGSHALGALDKEWSNYITFHLEVVNCEFCAANLADLQSEKEPLSPETRKRIFASSVGFLRKLEK